ncbi:MAG: hypothetical protein P8J33_08085, partial [Pirellulaceae bacterium]|nr:hypothetical protein [Pirellulaceae bacterium]
QQVIFQDGLMTCLSMQIIKTLPKVDSQDELPQIRKTLSRYFQQTAFAKMVSDRNRLKNLHRQAAILWVQFPDPLIAEMTLRMAVAQALGIREGLVVALEYLRRPDTGQSTSIRNALTLVADYGDESHIPLLERHLDNALLLHPRFVSENREQTSVYQVQVKDLVLSTMVHLAGLKYQNFGLNLRDISFQGQPLPIPHSGFLNSEDREAANKKWRTFRQTGNSKTSH